MNIKAVLSLARIISKNSEMSMPEKPLYKVLATVAVLGIMIPCTAIVGFISYVMTEALMEAGNASGGILFELQILSAFSMIFGILVIFSVLFFSSDREHFVTLPIQSHQLMMAKFLYAYVAESIMEFLILISVFVGYFIAIGKNDGVAAALNPVAIIASVLGVILIPLVPMIYCAIFSLILMAGLSGVKDAKIFYRTSSLFLLLFTAIFIYSLKDIGDVNMENYVSSLGSGNNLFLRTLNVIFFVVPCLAEAVGKGSLPMLCFYLAGNIALLVILYQLGKALYQKGLYTAAALGSSKKAEVKAKDIVEMSQFRATLEKEFKVILRTRAFSGNCAYINILWPVGALLLFRYAGDKGALAEFINLFQSGKERASLILMLLMTATAFIATALNSLASSAFTREGQHLALLKYIPVPFEIQMYAKAVVSFIFTYPALFVMNMIICEYLNVSVMMGALFAIQMLLAHIIAVFIGLYLDSSSPYVEWDDEYSALRGNLNVFFNMAIVMIAALVISAVVFGTYEYFHMPILLSYILHFTILAWTAKKMGKELPEKIVSNMKRM